MIVCNIQIFRERKGETFLKRQDSLEIMHESLSNAKRCALGFGMFRKSPRCYEGGEEGNIYVQGCI